MSQHLELVTGPVVVQSGTLADGSPTVTGLTTSSLAGAVWVRGTGIAPGTLVQSVDSASQVTLTAGATATGPQSLTFGLEPITLAEAKLHCRVEYPNDDALIASFIAAARLRAEVLTRHVLVQCTYDLFLDGFPCGGGGYWNRSAREQGPGPGWLPSGGGGVIAIPARPLVSVATVKYFDASGTLQTIDPAHYVVSTGLGARIQALPGLAWPITRQSVDSVVIRFVAGVATASEVSEAVKSACRLIVAHFYEHREEVSDTETYPVPNAVDALLATADTGVYR